MADDVVVIGPEALPLGLRTSNKLARAVVISLFTWRQAGPDDVLPSPGLLTGWWGDAFADVPGDAIGSRLYLLGRAKLLPSTPASAVAYAKEALAWLVADGIATAVDVQAERSGTTGLRLVCAVGYVADGVAARLLVDFQDIWGWVNV